MGGVSGWALTLRRCGVRPGMEGEIFHTIVFDNQITDMQVSECYRLADTGKTCTLAIPDFGTFSCLHHPRSIGSLLAEVTLAAQPFDVALE